MPTEQCLDPDLLKRAVSSDARHEEGNTSSPSDLLHSTNDGGKEGVGDIGNCNADRGVATIPEGPSEQIGHILQVRDGSLHALAYVI